MHEKEREFFLESLFVPFTTLKAVYVIVIVGFIVFGNMLFNSFVWDDFKFIITVSQTNGLTLSTLFGESIFNSVGFYRPITGLYFHIVYAIFKNTTFFYHLIQLSIHIFNAYLVFYLFSKFLKKELSFFLSLIFLIHPISVESVSYISAVPDILFFAFGMSALILSLSLKGNFTIRRISLIFLLLLLSVFSKEAGFLFILLILLYKILLDRKNFPFFLFIIAGVSLLYIFTRFAVAGVHVERLPFIPIASLSLFERILNIPAIFFYYIKTFFLPLQLSVYQQWVIKDFDISSFYFPSLIILIFMTLILLLGLRFFKANKQNFYTLLFFFGWLIAGFIIHAQIVPLEMTVSDHWFYSPIVGLLGIIGLGIGPLGGKIKVNIQILYMLFYILLVLLGFRTMLRNTNWVNNLTLFSHDIKTSDNFALQNELGVEYMKIKNYDLALKYFEKSAKLYPYETNLFNIGHTYSFKGDLEKAEDYYYKAINAKKYPENLRKIIILVVYESLAAVLILQDDPKAKDFINDSLRDNPNSIKLIAESALLEYRLGNHKEALDKAKQAYEIFPNQITEGIYKKLLNNEEIDTASYLKFFL